MRWPEAEFPIDEDLVRRLLSDQHPELASRPLWIADAGWDNVLVRLGDDLALRVPRRAVAAQLIEHEQRWLPRLAPRLPLPVPVPVAVGRPTSYYPWSWSVVPWLDGVPGDRARVTAAGSGADTTADRLGAFLAAMHVPADPAAPHNPARSGPVVTRAATFAERLERMAGHVDGAALERVWEDAVVSRQHQGPPLWLHGDLHPANILVRDGAVVAVIDFGDVCAGDPAVDLGAASMSLPERSVERLWRAYGAADDDLRRRAAGWSVLFGLILLEIGLEARPTYAEVGRATLERVAAEAYSAD